MSALGHKQTFAPQKVMSALRPEADIPCSERDVRFVPIADIRAVAKSRPERSPPCHVHIGS